MNERYDIAIIGSGPAGLSAALNAKIRNKSFLLFGNKKLSPKLIKAPKINNYLGFPNSTGEDLAVVFKNHLDSMDINIIEERINNVYAMGNYFALMVNEKVYEAKTVIIATGVEFSKPIKGESEFLGKGVGYCATCDAPLYKGKTVCVVSSIEEGEGEANYVNELAKKVYYIPLYRGNYELHNDIEIIKERPTEIIGNSKVEKLLFKERTIETNGVFFIKDAVSYSNLVPGLIEKEGHISVNRLMETNLKGCFAAGDCVGKPYQYIKAAGEGNIAVLSAIAYLEQLEKR